MPKYKKRSDGRYYTSIGTGEFNENGKEIRISVYGRTIPEFEENKDKVKSQIRSGQYANDRGTLFNDYKWQWYKTYIEDTELSHSRKQSYHNTLKNHTGILDSLALGSIKKTQVQAGYNKLNGHYDLQHEYKMTVNRIFETAIEDGLIFKNPANNLTLAKKVRKKKRALSKTERLAIPKAELTLKERCFIALLQYAGLRREEILALELSDINLEKETIRIHNVIEFIGERPRLRDSTKTISSDRTIDILAPLKPILQQYIEDTTGPILFPNNQETYMSKTQYRRFFENIKVQINLAAGGKHHYEKQENSRYTRYKLIYDIDKCPGLSAHVFRHEYATILYYSGIDLLEAIRLFGHSDSRTLTDIYAELRKEESNSKDKLNEYLSTKYS